MRWAVGVCPSLRGFAGHERISAWLGFRVEPHEFSNPLVCPVKAARMINLACGFAQGLSSGMMAEMGGGHFQPTLTPIGAGTDPTEPGHAPGEGELHHGDEEASVFIHEDVAPVSALGRLVRALVMVAMVAALLQLSELASAKSAENSEGQEHDLEHYGIFFQLFLLVVGMMAGYVLEKFHVTFVAEAGAVLLVGLLAGWIVAEDESENLAGDKTGELESISKFDVNFFFLFLLPPVGAAIVTVMATS